MSLRGVKADNRAQFNLIYSSLSKTADVREDLRAAIVDGKITPAKLAFLTSSELANAEQLAFIEAAQKESLRQTVKIKEQAVRIVAGRDGLERIDENGQRMDMDREVERDEERRQSMQELKRRESVEVPSATTPIASPLSPMDEKRTPEPRPEPVKRGSSGFTATSPYKSTVALHSAWGDAASPEAVDEEADVDGEIDLSGIADEDYASMDEDEPEEKAQVDTATEPEPEPKKNDVDDFNARSVLWSGNVSAYLFAGLISSWSTPLAKRRAVSLSNSVLLLAAHQDQKDTGRISFPTLQSQSQVASLHPIHCST